MKLKITRTDLSPASKKKLRTMFRGYDVDLDSLFESIELLLYQHFEFAGPSLPEEGVEDVRARLKLALKGLQKIGQSNAAMDQVCRAYCSLYPTPGNGADFDPEAVLQQQTEQTGIFRPARPALRKWQPYEPVLPIELITRLERAVEQAKKNTQGKRGRPAIDGTDRDFIRTSARIYLEHTGWKPAATPDPERGQSRKVLFSVFLAVVTQNQSPGLRYKRPTIEKVLGTYVPR